MTCGAIALIFVDRPFSVVIVIVVTDEQEMATGLVRQHIALKWMNYSSEFTAPTEAKTKA